MHNRTHVYGIDWSGAVDAGRKIWIARGTIEGHGLRIDWCRRARDLPGGTQERGPAIGAVRALIAREKTAVFGLDFPFGLPRELVKQECWEAFARSFASDHPTCAAFRERCRQKSGGQEFKRATDIAARTPFSPYNLRLYRQTYYGIHDLLGPLVRDGQASVLPMQAASPDRAWAIEICPTSTLKREEMGHQHYKSRGMEARVRRQEILAEIAARGRLSLGQETRERVVDDPGGDALDSVIAAFTTWWAVRDEALWPKDGKVDALEGYVYT